MAKIATIQKVELYNTDNHVTYLVRNVGKRAILVRLKNSNYNYSKEQCEKIAIVAAIKAAKLGYKRIVCFHHDDNVLKFRNLYSYYHCNATSWMRQTNQFSYNNSVLDQNVEYTVIPANYQTRKEPYLKRKESDGYGCILCAQNIDHGNCDNGF